LKINKIIIRKANVHNLKSVNLEIPKESLSVITGPSGSGKSSLAFDTIYVEGQRRYIESLSSYARQFLGQHQPPDVESIDGLSPAIAIDQKTSSRNPRSTVGTTTEIYDYMRVLFARVGTLYSPDNGEIVARYTPAQIVRTLTAYPNKTKIQLLAPVIKNNKGDIENFISTYTSLGFSRIRLNGKVTQLDHSLQINNKSNNNIDIVVDRLLIKDGIEKRLTDSVEYALKLSQGYITVLVNDSDVLSFSEHNMAAGLDKIYPSLEPRLFSFNSPVGACPLCNGIGQTKIFDKDLMILDSNISIPDGAITPLTKKNSFLYNMILSIAKHEKIDISKPYSKLKESFQKIIFEGSNKEYTYKFVSDNSHWEFTKSFPGIPSWLEKKYKETNSEKTRKDLENYMNINTCPSCEGQRLNQVALATIISKKNIIDLCSMNIFDLSQWFNNLSFQGEQKVISEKLLKEIKNRLNFLLDVGLEYLTLSRSSLSLSGGESQRIRLATQIGSALSGVLYVLDEPSIGLHQRDNFKLIKTLKNLRDLGNTVLVVEHDEDTMLESDYLIDMGPGAGIHGGEIIAYGKVDSVKKNKKSLTGQYLSGVKYIEVPSARRNLTEALLLKKAKQNNIDSLDVKIPLGGLVSITGVSGSGKSTLIHEVLVPALKSLISPKLKHLYKKNNYHSLKNAQKIQSVIELDQSPIGRTPHSNPATYTNLFTDIRSLFSKTSDSLIRGYKPGRFSFNVKGGRCEECEGNGSKKIEMHFLPDVYITCTECNGSRYNSETLSILYRGKNIADVLEMTIEEGREYLKNHPKMFRVLDTLVKVGLGYMKLGQSATTLSGGEAQRLKLARELSKKSKGHCLYVLDEPTTGLHFHDIQVLLLAITELVEKGHSVVVIEHNMDVIKTSDWVIDLGPEGGDKGGLVVAEGPPEEIAKSGISHTGKFLKRVLQKK